MKKKHSKIKLGIFKYLLILPLFLLTFCQSEFNDPMGGTENKATIDSKLLGLMRSAIQSDADQLMTQNKGDLSKGSSEDEGQCTNFLYPMTFQVYSGDDPTPVAREINSDEELIAFIEEFTFENSAGVFTPNYEMFLYFPIVLLDTDGNETVLNNLTELEGTLEMAVQACEIFNNSSDSGSSDDPSDGSDSSSSDGSDSSSEEESSDGSESTSDEVSNDEPGDSSGDESDSSSDDDADSIIDESSQGDHDDNGYKFCDKNNKKVYICHKGKTICVSVNAIWGHLQHHEEDFLGTCDDE